MSVPKEVEQKDLEPQEEEKFIMYLLDKRGRKTQLARLEAEVLADPVTKSLGVSVTTRRHRDPINTSALVTRAARAFFEIGRESAKAAAPPPQEGPPPTVFRETASGLIRVLYRELVIRFDSGLPERNRQAILKRYGFVVRRTNAFIPDQVVVYHPARKYTGEELVDISNRLTVLDEVTLATPNFVSQYQRQVPPSALPQEWHLHNLGEGGARKGEDINILEAWKVTIGKGIVVAVLDDGVDVDHPNLSPNLKDELGRDFFLPDDDPGHTNPRPKKFQFPFDQLRGNDIHGTACAGLVAAAGVGKGSVGVSPGCRLLPIKIFQGDDLAPDERIGDAIRYAANHADILSCSWKGGGQDVQQALEDAGKGRQGLGSAVFCAAGNDFGAAVGFPARDLHAIAVGASTDLAELAGYSNVGPEISIVAPSSGGVHSIFTTDVALPGRGFNLGTDKKGGQDGLHTNAFGGTSAATPISAGVGALVLSVHPGLSREDLKSLLEATADKIGAGFDSKGHSDEFGFGRINAGKAVQEAMKLAEK